MAFNNGPRGGGQPYNRQQQRPELPKDYLSHGYFKPGDADGEPVLRREFIIGYPEEIAAALNDRERNKSSQLRKFYDFVIRIRTMLEHGKSFETVEGEFCRIVGFAESAQGRNRVTPLFVEFIKKNVEAIQNKEDFYAFTKHFEAVIAYLKK